MRKVLFEGHWFQVCDNEAELKKEILKKYGVVHPNQELHHIVGRVGILRLMPDNVVLLDSFYHKKQKSLDIKDRQTFEYMVKARLDTGLEHRLKKLADYIKNKNVLFGK